MARVFPSDGSFCVLMVTKLSLSLSRSSQVACEHIFPRCPCSYLMIKLHPSVTPKVSHEQCTRKGEKKQPGPKLTKTKVCQRNTKSFPAKSEFRAAPIELTSDQSLLKGETQRSKGQAKGQLSLSPCDSCSPRESFSPSKLSPNTKAIIHFWWRICLFLSDLVSGPL